VQEAISGDSPPGSRLALGAFRGQESEVEPLVEAVSHDAVARGDGPLVALMHFSSAVLCNGLGRYDEALQAAQLGAAYPYDLVSDWVLSELVEAAARCGQPDAAGGALGRLEGLAHACGTDWIWGVEIRARALVADPADAEELHRHAIEHLGRTPFRTELARARLLYGEWLRRRGRRLEARAELRMFTEIGMEAFTERARKELAATGEQARKRTVETRDDLTAQERQIAQLVFTTLRSRVTRTASRTELTLAASAGRRERGHDRVVWQLREGWANSCGNRCLDPPANRSLEPFRTVTNSPRGAGRQLPPCQMDRRERPPDRRVRPPSGAVLGYASTCAAGRTRSKSSFREMLSVSAVMSTTLPSRICIKKA
jgi:hypothetical protein